RAATLCVVEPACCEVQVLPMPKRGDRSSGRRQSPGVSPVGGGRAHSADATSVVTFTVLTDAQWEAIRSTRTKWPDGIDCRREIEWIGQDYWDAQAAREMWVKKLQRNQPAKQRKKIDRAWKSTQQLRMTLAALSEEALL